MKQRTRNAANPRRDQSLWCDRCFIRIAPYEQQVMVAGRPYHSACFSRLNQTKRTDQKNAA